MFHVWSEPSAPPTGGGGRARPKVRLQKRPLWNPPESWKIPGFVEQRGKLGGFGQIFFDENTTENRGRKQHVAEKSRFKRYSYTPVQQYPGKHTADT